MITDIIKKPVFRNILELPASIYRGDGTVLMYHRVLESKEIQNQFTLNRILSVKKEAFEEQISYISKNMNCLGVDDFIDSLKSGKGSPDNILVSFDDGYLDNLEVALPILEKYNVPAIIFISTSFVDQLESPWWIELENIIRNSRGASFELDGFKLNIKTDNDLDGAFTILSSYFKTISDQNFKLNELKEKLSLVGGQASNEQFEDKRLFMNWDEVRKISAHPLITIGAHTESHAALSSLESEAAANEIKNSKEIINSKIGKNVDYFAYPYGGLESVSNRDFKLAEETRFKASFTTLEAHVQKVHCDLIHEIPRIMIDFKDDFQSFKLKLSGVYAFIRQRGRLIAYR